MLIVLNELPSYVDNNKNVSKNTNNLKQKLLIFQLQI